MRHDDDKLIQALDDLIHDQDAAESLPAALRDLSEGRLSPEEVAQLETLAGDDPAASRDLELFRPLDEAFTLQLIATADRALRATPPVAPVIDLAAARARGRPRKRALTVGAGLVASLAAALAFLLLRPADVHPPPEALPAYVLDVEGGDRAVRSAEQAAEGTRPVLAADSWISFVLRPRQAVDVPLAARAFVRRGGVVQPVASPVDAAPSGAFRLQGRAGPLLQAEAGGDVEVVFTIGPATALPTATQLGELLASPPSNPAPMLRILRQPVRVTPGP